MDLDFGARHVVDHADDELKRVVRDAIAAAGALVAAGACGVDTSVLADTLAGRGGRRLPYEFAAAIALVAGEEHRARIAAVMVRALGYAVAPIKPLTVEERLARLEYRLAVRFGEAGADEVERNRR